MVESARFFSHLVLTTITAVIYWACRLLDVAGTVYEFTSLSPFDHSEGEIVLPSVEETEAVSECRPIVLIGGWFKIQTVLSDSREDVFNHYSMCVFLMYKCMVYQVIISYKLLLINTMEVKRTELGGFLEKWFELCLHFTKIYSYTIW